jgi:lysozyme
VGTSEITGITAPLIQLVKAAEQWRSKPYLCPAGVPTIGWGHVIPSLDHPAITRAQGEKWLLEDLQKARDGALRYCPNLIGQPEARLAAVIDFVFNLGAGRLRTSRLRRAVLDEDWPRAAIQMRRWVYGGGRKLPGLVLRRAATSAWLETGEHA